MTKKETGMLWMYNRANERTLWQAYANPSWAKQKAFSRCQETQYVMNGYDGRITGHNCMAFSYAFRFMDGDTENLCYITRDNTYIFPIETAAQKTA